MPTFQKENEIKINRELDISGKTKAESAKFEFKITSSLEKIQMELAKGQANIDFNEKTHEIYEIKMFSTAIPDNLAKKSKPKIGRTPNVFKEDNLKKIETETLIGSVFMKIKNTKTEIESKTIIQKSTPPNPIIKENEQLYYLFMFIEKLTNVIFIIFLIIHLLFLRN